MKCEIYTLTDGTKMYVCGHHSSRRRELRMCRFCKTPTPSTKLCDFPTRGARNKTTCDAPICDACATSIGPDCDLCPPHAKLWKGT